MRGGDREGVLELTLDEAARGDRRRISLGDGGDVRVEIPRGVRDGQRIRLVGQGAPGIGGGPPGNLFLRVRLRPASCWPGSTNSRPGYAPARPGPDDRTR
jgi:curved DNA-binding protein